MRVEVIIVNKGGEFVNKYAKFVHPGTSEMY